MANGEHDKYKSHMNTCLTIKAYNLSLEVGKLDIKGVLIQTKMSGTLVYIQCKRKIEGHYIAGTPGTTEVCRGRQHLS
jgi:hypothetical protein